MYCRGCVLGFTPIFCTKYFMYIFVMVGDKSFGLEYDYFLPKEAVTFGRGCYIGLLCWDWGSHVENEEQVDPESYKN